MIVASDTLLAAYVTGGISIALAVGWRGFLKPLLEKIEKNTSFRLFWTGGAVEGDEGELTRIEEEFRAFHTELSDVTAEQARQREERVEEHERVLNLVHGIHRTQRSIAEALNRASGIDAEIAIHEPESERIYPDGSNGAPDQDTNYKKG